MRGERTSWPPNLPWQEGWVFQPSAWSGHPPAGPLPALRALPAIGEIALPCSPPPWILQTHPGGNSCRVWLLANGFVIESTQHPIARTLCLVSDEGVIWGRAPTAFPRLFSTEFEVHEGPEVCEVATPESLTVLRRRPAGEATLFALAYGSHDRAELLRAAERTLGRSPEAEIQAEFRRRAALWEHRSWPEAQIPAAVAAAEALVRHLRAPQGPFPHRWCAAADETGREVFDLRELFALCMAWRELDAEVAHELLLSALARQEEDGGVPALCWPDGSVSENVACPPLLAQAAAACWEVSHSTDFLAAVWPALDRYLTWALRHFDPDSRGVPRWRSAEEALVPEVYSPQGASPDTTALLLAEAEALAGLAEEHGGFAAGGARWIKEADRLYAVLSANFWRADARFFVSAPTPHVTFAGLTPLRTARLDARRRQALLAHLFPPGPLAHPHGVAAWTAGTGLPPAPRARALHHVLLLEALRRQDIRDVAWRLSSNLAGAASSSAVSRCAPASAETLSDAALTVLLVAMGGPLLPGAKLTRLLTWMERRRVALLAATTGTVAAGVVALAIYSLLKPTLAQPTFEALAGLAHRHYAEGRYDEALALYQRLARATSHGAPAETMLGNVYFRCGRYAEAEAHYRKALEKNPNFPFARLNLAVTLYRLGRWDEAREQYEKALESPVTRDRANAALSLLNVPHGPSNPLGRTRESVIENREESEKGKP